MQVERHSNHVKMDDIRAPQNKNFVLHLREISESKISLLCLFQD